MQEVIISTGGKGMQFPYKAKHCGAKRNTGAAYHSVQQYSDNTVSTVLVFIEYRLRVCRLEKQVGKISICHHSNAVIIQSQKLQSTFLLI